MIKSIRLTLLSTIALILLSPYSPGQTEKRSGWSKDTYKGLNISIRLDKPSYRLGNTATVEVNLKNIGDVPITIYKKLGWGCLGSLGYGLADSQGRGLMPTFIAASFYGPPISPEDFITLRPDEAIQTHREIEIGRQEGIKKPGLYHLSVWYNNPVSQDFAPEGLKNVDGGWPSWLSQSACDLLLRGRGLCASNSAWTGAARHSDSIGVSITVDRHADISFSIRTSE